MYAVTRERLLYEYNEYSRKRQKGRLSWFISLENEIKYVNVLLDIDGITLLYRQLANVIEVDIEIKILMGTNNMILGIVDDDLFKTKDDSPIKVEVVKELVKLEEDIDVN